MRQPTAGRVPNAHTSCTSPRAVLEAQSGGSSCQGEATASYRVTRAHSSLPGSACVQRHQFQQDPAPVSRVLTAVPDALVKSDMDASGANWVEASPKLRLNPELARMSTVRSGRGAPWGRSAWEAGVNEGTDWFA